MQVDHYVPDAAQRKESGASPLQASNLSGLPPAVVLTAVALGAGVFLLAMWSKVVARRSDA